MSSIDFHGKKWREALAEFIESYNSALQSANGTPVLDIIHGYGSTGAGGALRNRIRAFLEHHSDRLQFVPGETLDGNQGHTIVIPGRPLPELTDLLSKQILDYCQQPRTMSKITGRFRQHGDHRVMPAIRTLEKQGLLRTANRSRVKVYEAV